MIEVKLSRRNLQALLSKLDRAKAGESSACTLIKPAALNKCAGCDPQDVALVAVEDEILYADRQPGEIHPKDILHKEHYGQSTS